MGGRYRAYPEYKDSSVEWLGTIPAHWEPVRLKYFSRTFASNVDKKTKDGETPVLLCNYTDVYYNEAIDESLSFMKASATDEQIEKSTLQTGDTIITKDSEDPDDIAIPAYVPHDLPGVICGYHLSVIRPIGPNSGRFIKRLFECGYAKAYFSTRSNGLTRYGLGSHALGNVILPLPGELEQQQIANFLDYETAKIDTLIEKQQELIRLLKEKRQAVISHAVTKGLNPNSPMKPSGVAWLGDIPAHWKVCKLSYRYEVLLGKMLDDKKISGNFLGQYLRNTDVQWDRINFSDLPSMDFRPEEQSRYSVKMGDLLVCEGGEIGRCAIFDRHGPCYYQKALHRLRPINSKIDLTRFMFYLLFDAVHQNRFLSSAGKSTIAHLPAETFKQYRFCFPPVVEQGEIVSHLDTMKNRFDDIEFSANQQIELLQERRTALISAAVTGSIDVRNWRPPEPGDAGGVGVP